MEFSQNQTPVPEKEKSSIFSRISLTAVLVTAFVLLFVLTFAVIFIKYSPKQTSSNDASQQTSTRVATEAITYLSNSAFSSLSYPIAKLMLDDVTFGDIFSSANFADTNWECSLVSGGYLLEFSGIPLCKGEFKPSNISASFEITNTVNGKITITSFSISFSDGSFHSFGINDTTPSDKFLSLVRTQNAFESHMSTLFPNISKSNSNENDGSSSHKAFVL